MGIRRLALGTLLAAYSGYVRPGWLLGLLDEGLAGMTLFASNIAPLSDFSDLSCRGAIVAVDEEGGDVTRLDRATGSAFPGNAALGAIDDVALTRQVHEAIAARLRAAGITLDLAPVADVNTTADNPVIGTRSFGADPTLVARHTAAAVTGLQSGGVAACAKHFPGHGATVTDSHLALPTVDAPLSVLSARDLPPFAAAISAGVAAVMTAHIRIPSLTGTHPATFSRAVLHDLLRDRYAFRGAIITDALEMRGATAAAGSIGKAAVLSLAAGADLLCLGARVDAALVEQVVAEIEQAVLDGRLPLTRLEEAAARTAALAAWQPAAPTPPPGSADPARTRTGSPHPNTGPHDEEADSLQPASPEPGGTEASSAGPGSTRPSSADPGSTRPSSAGPGDTRPSSADPGSTRPSSAGPGSTEPGDTEPNITQSRIGRSGSAGSGGVLGVGMDVGLEAARRALGVEGSVEGFAGALVVQVRTGAGTAAGRVPWGLLPLLGEGEHGIEVDAAAAGVGEVVRAAGERPVVVVGRRLHRAAGREFVAGLVAACGERGVAVVETGWATAWRPAGVRAFLITHGGGRVNGRGAAEALGLTLRDGSDGHSK